MEYKSKRYITASMCDKDSKLSMISIFRMIQDAVTDHLGDLGIDGVVVKERYGIVWVFVRNNVRVLRYPDWRDECGVRCFISQITPVKMIIDTEILCADGTPAVRSSLEACLIDFGSGRIRRISDIGADKLETHEPLPGLEFDRFPRVGTETVRTAKIGSTTVDMCGHMNNVEYVRYILDSYGSHDFDERPIGRMDIHYIGQSYEGQFIDICRNSDGDTDLINVKKDGKTVTECLIERA